MAKEMMEYKGMHKCKGSMMLILGLLILGNAYWSIVGWDIFIGVILALAGLVKIVKKK